MQSTLYADYCERFRASCERARTEARAADPATDGNPTLCHNWGNEEARAAWQAHHDRNAKDYTETRRAMAAERHTEHIREGRAGLYLWCEHCQDAPAQRTEPATLELVA